MVSEALVHALKSQQFDPGRLQELFTLADQMEVVWSDDRRVNLLEDCWVHNLFFKASTRTHLSFITAEELLSMRRGFDVTDPNVMSLGADKAETVADTITTIESLVSDPSKVAIVVRDKDPRTADVMAKCSKGCHIINAGCGKSDGQHVTQGLMDLWTIFKHGRSRGLVNLEQLGQSKGRRRTLHIALVGDMRNGRTVRSLTYLLSIAFPWVKIYFFSPKTLTMGQDIKDHLDEHGIPWEEYIDHKKLRSLAKRFHVLVDTRFQREDLGLEDGEHFEAYQAQFQINAPYAARMKPNAIIMHPLPRNNELTKDVDKNPRAAYFRPQIPNGVIIRMALLHLLLKGPIVKA